MDFKELFEFAVAHDASDIHIQAGARVVLTSR
jgi:Tfp pilus assembly pilus retraction ATPase PilT